MLQRALAILAALTGPARAGTTVTVDMMLSANADRSMGSADLWVYAYGQGFGVVVAVALHEFAGPPALRGRAFIPHLSGKLQAGAVTEGTR